MKYYPLSKWGRRPWKVYHEKLRCCHLFVQWINPDVFDRYHLDKEEMFGTTWGLPSLKRSGPANFYFHISTSKTFKIFSHILKFQDFQLTFFQDDFCWWDQRALCNLSGSFITQLVRYHRFVSFRKFDFSKGKTFDFLFIFVICFRKWTSLVIILITFTNQCSFIWNWMSGLCFSAIWPAAVFAPFALSSFKS